MGPPAWAPLLTKHPQLRSVPPKVLWVVGVDTWSLPSLEV